MENKRRGLSVWQLVMMSLGTIIGGSFFIGSSVAIRTAGPAIVVSYVLGGILVYFILSALSEMIRDDPSSGSFRNFAAKAFGTGTGFVLGWVYWTGMILAMSSEVAALFIIFHSWIAYVPIILFGTVTIFGITLLNLLGADKFSKFESGLVAFKLFAILSFIIIGIFLILRLTWNNPSVAGLGILKSESILPNRVKGIAGSMLTVMFAYSGFEIIGLAYSETENPKKTIPKAALYTVLTIVGLYVISIVVIIQLIPTGVLNENISPMVSALDRWGVNWAGDIISLVMFTAMLSTMLAGLFGLGRMIRSLADEGYTPEILKDRKNVPYRGIIFSGLSMFIGLIIGLLFPKVYLFLLSSGGFALMFTYAVIVASQIRLRKKNKKRYTYSSWFTLISLIIIICSMPFVQGQFAGLIAGFIIIASYSLIYMAMRYYEGIKKLRHQNVKNNNVGLFTEFSEELGKDNKNHRKDTGKK
ncbi:amino acid permease [Clostridium sp. LBM24168]